MHANEIAPLDMYVYIPCIDETLHLTGEMHVLTHVTLDGNGGFHMKTHYQPQEAKGTTDISGYEYVGAGVSQWEENGKVGQEYTYTNNFNMIGKGKAPDFMVHEDMHITVRPDGTVTADHAHIRVTCK